MKCIMKNLVVIISTLFFFFFVACETNIEIQTFSVNYNTEHGNAPNEIRVPENTILTESQLPSLSAEGYSFLGWYDDKIKAESGVYKVTKNVNLTAKWNVEEYTITFYPNNGSIIEPQTIQRGRNVTIPDTPTKDSTATESYTFDGWYTSTDGGQTLSTNPFDFNTPVTSNITLYAKWSTSAITYTVSFNSKGGSSVLSKTVTGGNKVEKPVNPTKISTETKKFNFENWYTSNDGGVTLSNTPFDFNTPVTNNITLYAKWAETIFAYNITFNSKGGSSILNQIVTEGNKITRPASPIKTSTVTETYSFDNWYTSTDGGQTLSANPFDFNTPVTNDLTLYAKWTTYLITYTVTYETIRGTAPQPITVNATTILANNELPVLTSNGYYFEGWYDGNNKAIAGSYEVTKNITLHAKWDFEEPFTIECISSGSIKITNLWTTLKYTKNDGVLTDATKTIPVETGDKICFYASASENQVDKYMTINCTKDCYIYGNFMSLVSFNSETGEWNANATTVSEYAFTSLLKNNTYIKNHNLKSLFLPATTLAEHCYENMFSKTKLTRAPILPATTLAEHCYEYMFLSCSNLTTAPVLPATTLSASCYFGMFKSCAYLINAPELPATTLSESCYNSMFAECTHLVSAPELPATTLSESCYNSMFAGCTNLIYAPELPALTLAKSCYESMFNYCENLENAPELPATTLAQSCYADMFYYCIKLTSAPTTLPATTLEAGCCYRMFWNCSSLTQAPTLPATTLSSSCYSMMFVSCKNLKSAPELPATTLAPGCYENMFNGCENLKSAPVLLAKKLTERCYSGMFSNCSNLKYVKCLAEDISAWLCTNQMLYKVSSAGTFIKYTSMNNWTEGGSGIPTGWVVINATE